MVGGGPGDSQAAAIMTASAMPTTARSARSCDWLPQVVIWSSLQALEGHAAGFVSREGAARARLPRRRDRHRAGGRARSGAAEAGRQPAAAPARLARAAALSRAGRQGGRRAARRSWDLRDGRPATAPGRGRRRDRCRPWPAPPGVAPVARGPAGHVAAAGALLQPLRPEREATVQRPVRAPEAVLEDTALLLLR